MSIFKAYDEAFKAAQDGADLYQADQGLEKLGTSFHVFRLAPEGRRFGHETRCQVVRPMLERPAVMDFQAWERALQERPWVGRAGGFRAWFDEVMAAGSHAGGAS